MAMATVKGNCAHSMWRKHIKICRPSSVAIKLITLADSRERWQWGNIYDVAGESWLRQCPWQMLLLRFAYPPSLTPSFYLSSLFCWLFICRPVYLRLFTAYMIKALSLAQGTAYKIQLPLPPHGSPFAVATFWVITWTAQICSST